MHETSADDDRPATRRLLAHAATFGVWLTAALAVAGYASGDRYPAYLVLWTGLLSAAGLLAPLGLLGALGRRVPRLERGGPLMAAFCILFAAALSLDVGPEPRVATRLGAARLLALGVSLALAAWNLRGGRASRLSLGAAMALLCASWMLCGVLRGAGAPLALARPSILLPLLAAVAVLLPGLPRLDPPLSPLRWAGTLAAAAALVVLPLSPRILRAVPLAAPSGAAAAGGRSAVLIVLDTLRRDHLSLYGYARKTTPAIDEHAARGLVFDDATAVAPWTLPSHASMFTGLWPRSHGAHAFRAVAGQAGNISPLSSDRVTLAEIAREHGFRTAGFSSNNAYMSSRWGIDQGFEEYACRKPRLAGVRLGAARELAWRWDQRRALYEEMPYFTAPEMTRAAISWLGQHREEPFFLFLNYMDVHFPNAAPGTQGLAFDDEASLLGEKKHEGFARYFLGGALTPAERRAFVNEYDRELIHLDQWVGVLLRYIEQSGLGATTLVVLTSDHGEFLGEHELIAHMKDLYNEVVDVPLVVWEPGVAPGRSARPVQGLDLFPTILRYLGLPVPDGTQGQPLLEVDHATVSELYYALQPMLQGEQGRRYDRILRTIRDGAHRYFHSSNGEERLFRLGADPREEHNLLSEQPGVAAAARARLAEWLRATPEPPAPEAPQGVDPETLESLRALGYVR